MKDIRKIKETILTYLNQTGIPLSRVVGDGMKEKAVAGFSMNLDVPPFILFGPFQDMTREVVSIVHEAGHVMVYKELSMDDARMYLCTMFVTKGIGLAEVSPKGQESILRAEAGASASGFSILKEIRVDNEYLEVARKLMSQWYSTYEKLCNEAVVKKVRDRIIKDANFAFLSRDPSAHH